VAAIRGLHISSRTRSSVYRSVDQKSFLCERPRPAAAPVRRFPGVDDVDIYEFLDRHAAE
jgi:hypothetical protein